MLFFILYYQIRLYSDMLLQIFFLIMSFLGYHSWQKGKEESSSYEISYMHSQTQIILIVRITSYNVCYTKLLRHVSHHRLSG